MQNAITLIQNVPVTLSHIYILYHFLIPFTDAQLTVQVATSRTPPAPGIPPPEINYIDNANNTPGVTDNYTLSVLDMRNNSVESERE